jgi:hypothetical protein
LLTLINDIPDLSKIEAIWMIYQKFDLRNLIEEAITATLHPLVEKKNHNQLQLSLPP